MKSSTDIHYSSQLTSEDIRIFGHRSRWMARAGQAYALDDNLDMKLMDTLTSLQGVSPAVRLVLIELGGLA